MTCHQVLALADRYVDNDLSDHERQLVADHLRKCSACKTELQSTFDLLDLLKENRNPSPPEEYWQEVSALVLARTVESQPLVAAGSDRDYRRDAERRSFIRSLISAAASVVILISALILGNGLHYRAEVKMEPQNPVLLTSSLVDLTSSGSLSADSCQNQLRLAQGVSLLGPPGIIGKCASLPTIIRCR